MIRVEKFNAEKHYDAIKSWWIFHEWDPVPISHLPENGIVIYFEDMIATAGWLYKTDSAFCLFEWIVVNPEIRREKRSQSIAMLAEVAKEIAYEMGFKSIFMSARSEALISRLKKHGFEECDGSMKSLICSIDGGL